MRRVRELRGAKALALVMIVAVGTLTGIAAAQDASGDLQGYLTGNGLLNRGLYELAAPEYRTFLEEHPRHAKAAVARYGLAYCLYQLGELDDSLVELEQLVDIRGFEFEAEVGFLRGYCLMAEGEFGGAAEAFEGIVSQHAGHDKAEDAAAMLAEARYREGAFARVEPAAQLLASRWPSSPFRERAELFAGLASMSLRQYSAGADRFAAMLRDYPGGAFADQVSLLLAQCQQRSGSLQRAQRQFQSVIDKGIAAYVPDAMLGLAQILHRQGEQDEAGRTLDRLLATYPESNAIASARLQRGRVWFDLEDYGNALDAFESFAADAPPRLADDAAYWAAKSRLKLDRFGSAAEQLEEAMRDFPQSELLPWMMYDRALALQKMREGDASGRLLERFADDYQGHELAGAAMHLRTLIAHQNGDYDSARVLSERFVREHGDHAMASAMSFLIAENEYLAKEYDQAEGAYRRYLAEYPDGEDVSQAQYRLGMTLYRLDRFDEAETLLASTATGRNRDPEFRPALLALGDGVFARGEWELAQSWLEEYLRGGTDQPGADDALLKLGLSLYRQDKHDEALEQFSLLIETHPQSQHALQAEFERGQTYVALKRTDEAETSFESVLEEDDESRFGPHALNHLAAIAMQRQDYERADELYERVALASTDGDIAVESVFQRGQALMASGKLIDAITLFTQIVDEHGGSTRAPEARAKRAIALARVGEIDRALEELTQVAENGQVDAALMHSVAYEQAWCLKQLGRRADASAAYDALLTRQPGSSIKAYALLDRASIEMDSEEFAAATGHLTQVRALVDNPTITLPSEIDEQSLYRLGVSAYRLGDFARASTLLDQFVTRFKDSTLLASACLISGESHYKAGRFTSAASQLQRVVDEFEGDPSYPSGLLRLGESHVALQHWATGEEVFERYLEEFRSGELWFQARFGLGYAKENQGRYDEAIVSYKRVVSKHKGPTAARAQFQIGECLFAQKLYKEAATELLRVDILYAYPQWKAAAVYEAGRCFEAMGQMSEARVHFQDVVDRFEETEWARLATQRLAAARTSGRPGG